jgi:hypothetical protein
MQYNSFLSLTETLPTVRELYSSGAQTCLSYTLSSTTMHHNSSLYYRYEMRHFVHHLSNHAIQTATAAESSERTRYVPFSSPPAPTPSFTAGDTSAIITGGGDVGATDGLSSPSPPRPSTRACCLVSACSPCARRCRCCSCHAENASATRSHTLDDASLPKTPQENK